MEQEEMDLWQRYAVARRGRSPKKLRESLELRNQLVERYQHLAEAAARRAARRIPFGVEYEELLSHAYLGLIDAVTRFDPDRGIGPNTYMPTRIHFSITDSLRKLDTVSRTVRAKLKKRRALSEQLGHEPTDDEVQEHLGFVIPAVQIKSLEAESDSSSKGRGRGDTLRDHVADRHTPQQVSDCSELLRGLDKRERLVVMLYFMHGYRMKEVAETIGLSESRVSQMMTALRPRLKENAARAA
ncbi:sigma-70 family RNA polymerase sigma factor [Aureliella helgolandensis]|nr:sigma-70 family RNA polymerase sigma factor [Aureliella helgolandensis]